MPPEPALPPEPISMTEPFQEPEPLVELDEGAELMVAWQAGDEAAFERLVQTHLGRVHGLLIRFLGPRAPLDDLVQEVFLRVVRARDRYEPTARFTTWLFRIVYNLSINHTERRRPTARSLSAPDDEGADLEVEDELAPSPSESLERADLVQAVQVAIAELPERQRMALVLAKFEHQPYTEIGEVLGLKEQAVKSLIHRARENLRTRLAPLLAEDLV